MTHVVSTGREVAPVTRLWGYNSVAHFDGTFCQSGTAMEPPRIVVFSTPLVATWALDETHRVLFDAGDGATALLEGKIHKANVVALTHAHRDHIAGLPQLLNLRGGVAVANGEPLRVVYPEGSSSVEAMARFLAQ